MTAPIKVPILGIDKFTKVLGGITSRVGAFGKRMQGIGKNLTIGLSVPAALFGKSAVTAAADFEKSFTRVGVLSGATGAQLSNLRDMLEKIGTTTRFSSVDAVKAFELMTDSGFKFEQSLAALPGVLQLSQVGAMEMSDAVTTFDTILEAYGKTAADASKITDMMAAGAHAAGESTQMMAKGMLALSPAAQALKMPLEDVSTMLALVGSSGLNLQKSNRSLATGLLQLVNPSTTAIDAFNKLGIAKSDIFKKDGGIRSLGEVFDVLRRKGASGADMMDIFGISAGPVMEVLVKRGTGALKEISGQMTGMTGTADELTDKLGGTYSEKLMQFTSGLTSMKVIIGNEILPILIPFGKAILSLMQTFTGLPKPIKFIIAVLGILATIIPPLILMIGGLAVAFETMNLSMMSIPVFGWILAGIALVIAGIVLLVKHWDKVVGAIKRVGQAIKSFIPQGVLDFMGMGDNVGPRTATALPAAGMRERMAAAPGTTSTTNLIIDNKNGSAIQAKTQGADMNLQTYFGAVVPALP